MTSEVTIVSALFNIGRGRWKRSGFPPGYDRYEHWVKSLLSLDACIHFFVDNHYHDLIVSERRKVDPNFEKTVIVNVSLDRLHFYKNYYVDESCLMASPQFRQRVYHPDTADMNYPLYHIVNFSKIDFIKQAMEKNAFGSSHYFWVDAGGLRGSHEKYKNVKWPNFSSDLFCDKIVHFSHNSEFNIYPNKNEYFLSQVRNIQGTAWIVPKDRVNDFFNAIDAQVKTIIQEKIVGSDEKVYDFLYKENPTQYKLIKCGWFEFFDKAAANITAPAIIKAESENRPNAKNIKLVTCTWSHGTTGPVDPPVYVSFKKFNPMGDLPSIALNHCHNASVVVYHNDDIVEVVELERLLGKKNASFDAFEPVHSKEWILGEIYQYFLAKYGYTKYQKFLCNEYSGDVPEKYKQIIPAAEYINEPSSHHVLHGCNSLYQSPFDEAVVISFDGGGMDGHFNVYLAKRGYELELMRAHEVDLGSHYHVIGSLCKDIANYHVLTAAGKVLGLQSFGKVRPEWKGCLRAFFCSTPPYWRNLDDKINTMSSAMGISFSQKNRLEGQLAYDFARTAQEIFEEVAFELIDPHVSGCNLPIILTGGCALNIVFNTSVKRRYNREVFVAPNSNDCGLAVGLLLKHARPKKIIDVTYKGIGVIDRMCLMEYVELRRASLASIEKVAKDLSENRILGIVQGSSEHGPRALGNRSIICSPIPHDMKDVLNAKIKHREWFRPFAPIVRLEDVSEYFEWDGESRWMNFCPMVREQYKNRLPAVTHVDGTARVQTVTREQNPFIYDVLTEFKTRTGIGVLVNTSFNVDGKPILSSYKDAFKVFDETELDRLYLDGYYFTK